MARKTFKDNTAHLDRFFSDTEPEVMGERKTQRTHKTDKTYEQLSVKYYRLNLKLKAEYKEYLEEESWKARKSITQYINDLIQADKDTKNT